MQDESFVVDLYIRVSTDRQVNEGDSLEEQENELKKFCDYRKFSIHHTLIEKGRSGGNTNRPEYQRLIEDVKQKRINAVVVKKLDRLSRSLLDFEQLMTLLRDNDVEFISLKESFDTTSAMGKAMLRVALVFAQLEREQTSERLIDVLEYRASQGLHNGGVPPYGYTHLNKERIPLKKEKEIVELIYDRFLVTHSTTEIARYLNENGFRYRHEKLWDKRNIHKILQRSCYKGDLFWKGKIYAGNHQPIISPEKFDKVQALFRRKSQPLSNKNSAVLQRLLFCGDCGVPMTPNHTRNRHKVRYYYYRCVNTMHAEKGTITCKVRYVSVDVMEKAVVQTLSRLASSEIACQSIAKQISEHNQKLTDKVSGLQNQSKALDDNLTAIREKKDKYLDSLLETHFTSLDRKRINEKLTELEHQEQQLKSSILKFQLDQTTLEDEKVNITQFKKMLLAFQEIQTAHPHNPVYLREYLLKYIQEIRFYKAWFSIRFKMLSWSLDYDMLIPNAP